MNTQPTLFDAPRFAGKTVEAVDVPRLESQFARVWEVVKDGKFRTFDEIAAMLKRRWPHKHDSIPAISARLRDFRKQGHEVLRQRRGEASRGLFEYSVRIND